MLVAFFLCMNSEYCIFTALKRHINFVLQFCSNSSKKILLQTHLAHTNERTNVLWLGPMVRKRLLKRVVPNLFLFAAPLHSIADIWRHLRWSNRYKNRGIVTFGGIPVTSSRQSGVLRHPGWEPLS